METQENGQSGALALDAGSHPSFRLSDATHGAQFILSCGSKLTILRGPAGIFIDGEYGSHSAHIALGEEATDILISALMLSRPDPNKPLPNAKLMLFANKTAQQRRTTEP